MLTASGLAASGAMWPRLARSAPGDDATLLVAGAANGSIAQWATVLTPALSRCLAGSRLQQENVGGEDGVTGANQFEARAAPDGQMALLLPGRAALAWLTGDQRAQFNAATWIPALATVSAGVLASRIPIGQFQPGQRIRLAASFPAGAELPALLALDMLRIDVMPVFGLMDDAGVVDAVLSGTADAAFLRGSRVAEQVGLLAGAGAPPTLTMGAAEASQARDPSFPAIPTLLDVAEGIGRHRLYPAWRAAAAAAQTDTALVLPQLTPAGTVAAWRKACSQAVALPEMQDAVQVRGVRPLAAPAVAGSTGAIATDAATLLGLRRWLAERWNWRPA